jgi:hypothetical protein
MPSIYDFLAQTQLEDVTVTQLASSTGRTYTNQDAVEFWRGVLTVSKAMEASRTYFSGLPIPEASDVEVVTVSDSATGTLTPDTTEIYYIQNISTDQDVVLSLMDSDGHASLIKTITSSSPFIPAAPFYLTKTMFLSFANGSGSAASIKVGYHKMSL